MERNFSFVGVVILVLLSCATTNAQTQFAIIESAAENNESIDVGNVTIPGTQLRFKEPQCREPFTVDESGAIRSKGEIDRELPIIRENIQNGRLSCRIEYIDFNGDSADQRIEIEIFDINDNSPEFTNVNLTGLSVTENSIANQQVTSFTVKDPDNGNNGSVDIVLSGMGARFFKLDLTRGSGESLPIKLQTSNENIDLEMHQQLNVTITATDRGTPPLTGSVVLTINVLDVNEFPPVFNLTQYIFKNVANTAPVGTIIGTVSAMDADMGRFGVIQYSISSFQADSCQGHGDLVAINSFTGEIYLNQMADNITCNIRLGVEVSNEGGSSTSGGALVHVSVVVPMLVFNPYASSYTFEEHKAGNLFSWLVNGGANYSIRFDQNILSSSYSVLPDLNRNYINIILILNEFDREEIPFISGTLTVYADVQGDEPPLPGVLNFTFTVLDINDNSPVFERTYFTVQENSHIGYNIGLVVAGDPDEGVNASVNYTLLNSTYEGLVTLHSNGSLIVDDAIDFEQIKTIQLGVRAQDQGTPPMHEDGIIFIDIINVNDELPKFSDIGLDQYILTSTQLPFVWNVTVTDDDSGEFGEVVKYSKVKTSVSNDASMFVILNQQSGQLMVEQLPEPSSTPYVLVLEAVDGGNGTSSATVTINVWTDFCGQSPCSNGATCTNVNNSYTCDCTEKYGGPNCSILKNPCNKIEPCFNHGTCMNTEDELDFYCVCTNDYSGKDCTYSTVSFKPRSFRLYHLPGVSANARDLHVSLQIAPKFLNGLLLYVGGEDDNFVSLELDDGRAMLRTSHNTVTDDNMMVMTDGMWYLITMVIQSGTEPSVTVAKPSSSSNLDSNNPLPSDGQLVDVEGGAVFIGGLPADPDISYEHVRYTDYVGCMRDLFVNGERVVLTVENQRLQESHNTQNGCNLDQSRSCGAMCNSEGCIDFLSDPKDPFCDCTLSNCTSGVPTAVGFTGQANLIVDTSVDFFIATRQSRHKQNADKPDVTQTVSFRFSSTTKGAVLLSATFQSNSLRVFSFNNGSLNYDIYEGDTRCGYLSLTGVLYNDNSYDVKLQSNGDKNLTLSISNGQDINTTTTTITCPSNRFVEYPSSKITIAGVPAMMFPAARLPNKDFRGCISDLVVDDITVPLSTDYPSDLVMLQEEGNVNEVHDGCVLPGGIGGEEEESGRFLELYVIVIIAVVVILVLVAIGILVLWSGRKCLHNRPNKSRFDMAQEMPDTYQDSPPSTLNFRKKTEFDNASVGHYQEEGEEAMPDAAAISIDSLRKSANSSSSGGTGSSIAETGFHTGSERDHTSDAGFPEPAAIMVNEETPSEVQESEYSTFMSDSDITSAVEQTLSPLDVQLLGPPNVLGMPPPPQARSMARKPSPMIKDPPMLPMERKRSPFHPRNMYSMSTIESGSESSLGPPPPPDPILNYPHPSASLQHEPRLPGLKTLCGPDFNPISYWEQQSRLKPSIDPDYPLQRLSLASGRGTEDPSTVSVASTLEEQHEFASQGGGEGEATNMRDGLESDHELDYRLADLHIPEYESMTLSQSTLVGGSEEYFPDATIKPCHPIIPVHDNSVSSNSPYHTTLPDHLHSPHSMSSSSTTSYEKNSHHKLLSEQDLPSHDRYYERSRTGTSKPSHMDHRFHAQYSNTSSTSSASTPQTRKAWRSEDPINV